MPVVLSEETWDEWLGPGPLEPSRLRELFEPAPEGVLGCHRVGSAVNSARNDRPELVTLLTPETDSAITGRVVMDER